MVSFWVALLEFCFNASLTSRTPIRLVLSLCRERFPSASRSIYKGLLEGKKRNKIKISQTIYFSSLYTDFQI